MADGTDTSMLLAKIAEQQAAIERLQDELGGVRWEMNVLEEAYDRMSVRHDRRVSRRRTRTEQRIAQRPAPQHTVFPLLVRGADLRLDTAIYGLVDPRDPTRVRYVGQARRPIARMVGHLGDTPSHNPRGRWVAALLAEGVVPDMVLLERVPAGADIDAHESYWIHTMRGLGHADLNSNIPRRRVA